MSKDNIVLLPTTAADLELEIASLMQKKEFKPALESLQLLLRHDHHTYNVYRDTLTCLMKLGETGEALDLCEKLMADELNGHYYDYLEFYTLLLYETEAYLELIEIVEANQVDMPEAIAVRTNEFKILAVQMRDWQREEILAALKQAIKENDYRKQYRLLIKWRSEKFPELSYFEELLKDSDVHPVIKTEIFFLLQENGKQEPVKIKKFNQSLFISPGVMIGLEEHPRYFTCLKMIEEIEQHDPVLYMHTKELIHDYAYVLYPFFYADGEVSNIAEAALAIAKANLGLEEAVFNERNAKDILICQQLYHQVVLS